MFIGEFNLKNLGVGLNVELPKTDRNFNSVGSRLKYPGKASLHLGPIIVGLKFGETKIMFKEDQKWMPLHKKKRL